MTTPLGLIGGTGFYTFFTDAEDVEPDTPYGRPSGPISMGEMAGRPLAFLPRHGRQHDYLPSELPYRANLWALRELGVRQVVGFNTVGSLQPDYRRGDLVLADQFVDRTSGRVDSFFGGRNGAHISSAEPYCGRSRAQAVEALGDKVGTVHPTGTVVVIQGPRFSTRAESAWFTAEGWHLVNMTQYPEVVLARELELCYVNLSYVTDYDVAAKEIVGAAAEEDIVSHHGVLKAFNDDADRVRIAVSLLAGALTDDPACSCRTALETARV
jgi:5'-methylthioadenosine phosphorylase